MSVRQYIGARYIPLFADPSEWSNDRTYEPLTIVLHNGNSFTSKQYVPIGIDINNTQFWAETGNYSAQIEAYRQEVLRFDSRITQNSNDISAEETARANADTALGGRITQNANDISAEETARANADTALGGRITQEATARENADTALGGRITQEATARENADTALGGRISTETTQRQNADTALGGRIDTTNSNKIPFPISPNSKYGSDGQVLRTNGDGTTMWQNPAAPTDQQASAAISEWLTAHPEATTTVQDGSITQSKLAASLENAILDTVPTHIGPWNYSTLLPTLSQAPLNSIIIMTFTQAQHPADYPTRCGYQTFTLLTYGFSEIKVQYVIPNVFPPTALGVYGMRSCINGEWGSWSYSELKKTFKWTEHIGPWNYGTEMTYLGNARANSVNAITMTEAEHQPDYPSGCGYRTYTLVTIGEDDYRLQYMLPQGLNGIYAFRAYYNSAWQNWSYKNTNNGRSRITVGASGADYTSLSEALEVAYSTQNCDVYVMAGNYDVVADFKNRFGNDYFENQSFTDKGMIIGHGCKYMFEAGSTINCILPSTASTTAQNLFSPFMAGQGDYEIYGLHVYSENCRYCVHDEKDSLDDYTHIYKNCDFHHNDTGAGYPQCIGGGLGAHGLIEIEGCVFKSEGVANTEGIVSWHNGSEPNIQSRIYIRDCYFVNGCVRLSWYGTSTLETQMYLTNCSFKNIAYVERGETQESTTINTKIYAWNNETNRQ